MMDIDYGADHIRYDYAGATITIIKEDHLSPEELIETHAHTDHLSIARSVWQ